MRRLTQPACLPASLSPSSGNTGALTQSAILLPCGATFSSARSTGCSCAQRCEEVINGLPYSKRQSENSGGTMQAILAASLTFIPSVFAALGRLSPNGPKAVSPSVLYLMHLMHVFCLVTYEGTQQLVHVDWSAAPLPSLTEDVPYYLAALKRSFVIALNQGCLTFTHGNSCSLWPFFLLHSPVSSLVFHAFGPQKVGAWTAYRLLTAPSPAELGNPNPN